MRAHNANHDSQHKHGRKRARENVGEEVIAKVEAAERHRCGECNGRDRPPQQHPDRSLNAPRQEARYQHQRGRAQRVSRRKRRRMGAARFLPILLRRARAVNRRLKHQRQQPGERLGSNDDRHVEPLARAPTPHGAAKRHQNRQHHGAEDPRDEHHEVRPPGRAVRGKPLKQRGVESPQIVLFAHRVEQRQVTDHANRDERDPRPPWRQRRRASGRFMGASLQRSLREFDSAPRGRPRGESRARSSCSHLGATMRRCA